MRKYTSEQLISVFWFHVNKDGSIPAHMPHLGKCWEWTRKCNKDGYGIFHQYGKYIGTHRFSWQLEYGEIPKGLEVCHHCDNPKCVNPKHLWLGTHGQNVRDRDNKRRGNQPKHEKHNKAKLNKAIVAEIRERYAKGGISQEKLGKEYGVTQCNIGFIIRNVTWVIEE